MICYKKWFKKFEGFGPLSCKVGAEQHESNLYEGMYQAFKARLVDELKLDESK